MSKLNYTILYISIFPASSDLIIISSSIPSFTSPVDVKYHTIITNTKDEMLEIEMTVISKMLL